VSKKNQQSKIPFKIEHLDPLGQGVSKITDKITFIPKTLPGEEGEAIVHSSKKGVQFAYVDKITSESAERIDASCMHFNDCLGCDYLHTPYEFEILHKENAIRKRFEKLVDEHFPFQIHKVKETTSYRNRIQLHYDKKRGSLGFVNTQKDVIVEVPKCQLPLPSISKKLKELYEGSWKSMVQYEPDKGHIELYQQHDEVKININKPYADGGFTQVHDYMNKIMKSNLNKIVFRNRMNKSLIELFAGAGNLSNDLIFDERHLLDYYTQPKDKSHFHHYDLYDKKTLKNFLKKSAMNSTQLLLLDPPRSGLKNLDEWVKEFSPAHILYVSCDSSTLIRDISKLDYQIQEIHLFDMFPGSAHFETMVHLTAR
jgi:23S rRNA (uracil1939-C5)-methyltransferase